MRDSDFTAIIDGFIRTQRLPSSFQALAEQWYLPLAGELAGRIQSAQIRVLGISGSQGSGKSTLAAFLLDTLTRHYSLRCVSLSMDDFYLTRAERTVLADTVHPLLITRGVPGTHDIPLFLQTLRDLRDKTGSIAIARFDKARDDRKPAAAWDPVSAPVDLIIIEGWCLNTPPQSEAELQTPVNELEAREDGNAIWRTYVNRQLRGPYQDLFNQIDLLIFLRAPSFGAVYRWRGLQEKKLIGALATGTNPLQTMDDAKLRRFIQHFERLTLVNLQQLPKVADIVFELNDDQQIVCRR